jgi:hypothetical protein
VAIAAGDWRDADSYAHLLAGDRRCFAWEWLRRTPPYVDAWRTGAPPGPFGLVNLEDPALGVLAARPMWTDAVDRAVLLAGVRTAAAGDPFDFSRISPMATITPAGQGRRHVLLSDGLRSIRMDLIGSAALSMPMAVTWHIPGVTGADARLTALAQFLALARRGRFSRHLHPPERRAARWIAMLRVHDALAMGATNREIVTDMFDVDTGGPRWRAAAGSWRLKAQRLAAGARFCLAMGPAGWLGGGFATSSLPSA